MCVVVVPCQLCGVHSCFSWLTVIVKKIKWPLFLSSPPRKVGNNRMARTSLVSSPSPAFASTLGFAKETFACWLKYTAVILSLVPVGRWLTDIGANHLDICRPRVHDWFRRNFFQ